MNVPDEAIVELQTRMAFQEDTINQLNEVVSRQDRDILLLKEQLRALAQRLQDLQRQPAQNSDNLLEERPPHY